MTTPSKFEITLSDVPETQRSATIHVIATTILCVHAAAQHSGNTLFMKTLCPFVVSLPQVWLSKYPEIFEAAMRVMRLQLGMYLRVPLHVYETEEALRHEQNSASSHDDFCVLVLYTPWPDWFTAEWIAQSPEVVRSNLEARILGE